MELISPPKVRPGDRVAELSPSFAAPAIAPEVHDQAMTRLAAATGLVPVEYPTTRRLGASPIDRAADLNAAFADPSIRAVLATIGGDDQITVIPHLDAAALRNDPKPFLGYSDNTNLLNWLWCNGIASFHGGSTQVHLGAGSGIDPIHLTSLRAALLDGGRIELTEPGESEDFGLDWQDPAALTTDGVRRRTQPWRWAGPAAEVTGRTWGGCLEVLSWVLTANRFHTDATCLAGCVLLFETSEQLISADEVGYQLRAMGERGLLEQAAGFVIARPPTTNFDRQPDEAAQQAHVEEQAERAIAVISHYNDHAPIVIGPPFGHTRPQWIVPYGGEMTIDGVGGRLFANYG